jgi:hypothetical protein
MSTGASPAGAIAAIRHARAWAMLVAALALHVADEALTGFLGFFALATPAVRHGVIGTVFASWMLSIVMLGNGVGHLAGSAYFQRWLPGATSAPLLLAAGALLAHATWTPSR